MLNSNFFINSLYPFQDRVLQLISALETDFYLTGGTAASRGYLNHRFSEDLADIWGFCKQMRLSLQDAIVGAQRKAADVFPVDLARVLLSANESDWELIRWINPPEPAEFVRALHEMGEKIILSAA